jgi:hypothetical protein
MSKRQQTGGTLALIAACTIIIILVGIGMFLLMQMIGGGREAQHATDAGNLNVAKKSLVSPTIQPTAEEKASFEGLFARDGSNNEIVNLQTYNKFVGKAFLVALNAEAENTDAARAHATTEHKLVEGDGGMGSRLWSALHDPSKTTGFFEGVAQGNSIRMLDWSGKHVGAEGTRDKVGFMRQAQGAPSNVAFDPAEIPAELATNPIVTDTTGKYIAVRTTAGGLQKRYLVGYEGLPIGSLKIFAVPVRPGEQPHLVSQEQFETALAPPTGLGSANNSLIPPNAFESNSTANEMVSTGNVKARSSAIVGTLNTDFSASIPHGFVIIDNMTTNLSANVPGFINDIFADALMGPGVTVAKPDHVLSANAGDFQKLKDAQFDPATGNLTPAALNALHNPPSGPGIDIKPPKTDTELSNIAKNLRNNNETTFPCSGSVPAGSPGSAFSNPCKDELDYIQANYPPDGTPTSGGPQSNLMAVEYLKAKVLEIRAGYDDIGCGDAYADGSCTGLKRWDHGKQSYVPFHYNNAETYDPAQTEGTLTDLLNQTNGTAVTPQIVQRMHQMNPEASDYASVFNTKILMNTVGFLYYDDTAKKFLIKNALPFPRPNTDPGNADSLPDGGEQEYKSVVGDLNGLIINVPGESGYPNPWDCPPSSSNQGSGFNDITVIGASSDKALWQPSSGFKNLLGILKLRNCAKGGGHWCCPC